MRVAIAGGSMGGLFAAALLRRAGHGVTVFERSSAGLAGRGAGLVAQQEVFTLLQAIGREEVARIGVMAKQRVTLDRSGRTMERDPRPQMQISWDHLYLAVRSLLDDDSYRTGQAVLGAGQDDGKAWLQLENGGRIDADLVVGADGIGSAVRAAVTGSPGDPQYAGYVAWRALLPEQALPAVADRTLSDQFAFFHMPGGQALGYTVAGPAGEVDRGRRRYNCVWYRRVADLRAVLTDAGGRTHPFSLPPGGVDDGARHRLIEDAHRLLPPPFAAVFAAEDRPFVQAIFDLETPTMTNGRLILIGDSAFVARPHTAMGVAKAAGDALALSAAVAAGWTDSARAAFERERVAMGRSIVSYGKRLGASLGP